MRLHLTLRTFRTKGFEVSLARSPSGTAWRLRDTRGFEHCRTMRAYVAWPLFFTPFGSVGRIGLPNSPVWCSLADPFGTTSAICSQLDE